jgi:starch-binding outer membrane protein, SusD/RagB family
MKKYAKNLFVAVLAGLGLVSCVNDLNTEPIDPNTKQTFDQDMVFRKIYTGFSTSGQVGPSGDCDIIANDEGYSVFWRVNFWCNELPTDAGWWIWGSSDAGCSNLLELTDITSENQFLSLLYNRLTFNVALTNHFLDETEGKTDDKTKQQRAEVRFVRALNYYYLMDFFANPPFKTTVKNIDLPTRILRADLFDWIVKELEECQPDMAVDIHFYRASQSAADMLLMRLYLNAEVYTGAPQWEKAAEYAKKVMDKYPLAENYAQLFMGDNDKNPSAQEVVFMLPQDGIEVQSYGGSSCMVSMTRSEKLINAIPAGSTEKWECWRATPELILAFIDKDSIGKPNFIGAVDEITKAAGDDRAMFCNKAGDFEAGFEGPAEYGTGNFEKCWSILKWTGIYSDGVSWGSDNSYVDTDIPFMRSGEAYMTYAEALYRQGKKADALSIINDNIRKRAHAAPLTELNDETLLAEWLREFYCEGRRRIDLVRFGQFAGDKATMHWEGRGKQPSSVSGGHLVKVPVYYNIYPIPNSDIIANKNLKQNDGY